MQISQNLLLFEAAIWATVTVALALLRHELRYRDDC